MYTYIYQLVVQLTPKFCIDLQGNVAENDHVLTHNVYNYTFISPITADCDVMTIINAVSLRTTLTVLPHSPCTSRPRGGESPCHSIHH